MASKDSTQRRAARVRRQLKKVAGDRPRLSVHRSSKHIYAQIIDDAKGHTLAAASTIDGDLKGGAELAEPCIAESAHPLDERCGRDALDGVEVDGATPLDRILVRLEHDFADQPPHRCRAGSDERPAQAGDGGIAR